MIKCPNCGKRNSEHNNFCSECGTDLSEAGMICCNCYEEYYEDEKFCTNCGNKLTPMKDYFHYLELKKREQEELEEKRRIELEEKRRKELEKKRIEEEKKQEMLERKHGTKICPHCGEKILKNAIRCKYCRTNLIKYKKDTKIENKPIYICSNCGKKVNPTAIEIHGKCPHCGVKPFKPNKT